jgi:hypothetical protein
MFFVKLENRAYTGKQQGVMSVKHGVACAVAQLHYGRAAKACELLRPFSQENKTFSPHAPATSSLTAHHIPQGHERFSEIQYCFIYDSSFLCLFSKEI